MAGPRNPSSSSALSLVLWLWVEELEDLQFPADPFPGSRDEVFFAVEALRRQFAVLGETVGADAEGVELVAVDVLSAAEGVGGL